MKTDRLVIAAILCLSVVGCSGEATEHDATREHCGDTGEGKSEPKLVVGPLPFADWCGGVTREVTVICGDERITQTGEGTFLSESVPQVAVVVEQTENSIVVRCEDGDLP